MAYELNRAGTAETLVAMANGVGKAMQDKVDKLEREIRYLRCYGNKDCTAMADEAMELGTLDT